MKYSFIRSYFNVYIFFFRFLDFCLYCRLQNTVQGLSKVANNCRWLPRTRPFVVHYTGKNVGYLTVLKSQLHHVIHSFIHSFSSLFHDRSKASSKASSPHSAIMEVPFLNESVLPFPLGHPVAFYVFFLVSLSLLPVLLSFLQ
jgi:hypothetical protein